MKHLITLTAVVALAGCENGLAFPDLRGALSGSNVTEASDPTLQPSDRERVIAAIETNGCVVNEFTVAPIMAQASVNREQLFAVAEGLEADGSLAAPGEDGSVRLVSPNCPALI